ncbi:MAG: hypothetical protein QW507_01035 [Candidatus Nanoarchaeia archaeon]|nr:hypothetical protein [Candidatus Haiyanarchaeum thermophilum]MCW1303914.1 hypothetical protein [Candidatus Haiyanarchaeum thermophilum]MCW1306761.1 hypothetical protein [Candidatus Haiyanarchaeum thermophilum]MCW1307425.1 hypothetical protein [Candidatus Haiyanarchaeum thermophilum]MCW1308161.1 hypothetical protein [Candidatus Haiyanarchaeum thermophilum]
MRYAEKLSTSFSIYFTNFKRLFPYSLICVGTSSALNQLINFIIAQVVEKEILYQGFIGLREVTLTPLFKIIGISMLLHFLSFPIITYLLLLFFLVVVDCMEGKEIKSMSFANKIYFKFLTLNLVWLGIFFIFSILIELHPIALVPLFLILPIFIFSIFSMLMFNLGVKASFSAALNIFRKRMLTSIIVVLIAILVSMTISLPFYLAASLAPFLTSLISTLGIVATTPPILIFLLLAFRELSQE